MTKLMKKRIEIIIDAMKTEGIEFDNSYFMTMWSLACYINNNLYYKHFTTGKKNKIFRKGLRALDSHEILALYPAIRRTVSKSDKLQLEKIMTTVSLIILKECIYN